MLNDDKQIVLGQDNQNLIENWSHEGLGKDNMRLQTKCDYNELGLETIVPTRSITIITIQKCTRLKVWSLIKRETIMMVCHKDARG